MDFKELQKKYQDFYTPNFVILVNGEDLLKKSVEVFGITVNLTLEGAADFSFTINNPLEANGKEFKYLQNGLFEVDNNVEIKIGYGDRRKLESILVGNITSVDVSFPANGISQLTIKGFDRMHKMTKEQKSKPWGSDSTIKYSEIVQKVTSDSKYRFDRLKITDTKEKHQHIKQDRESDYNFIKSKLASKVGFELFVLKNELYFRPPANDKKDDVVTNLTWRRSLLSFSPTINLAEQVSEVEVRGWDPNTQQAIIGKAKKGDEQGRDGGRESGADKVQEAVKHFWRPSVASKTEANQQAKSILNKLAEKFVTGNGECIGIPSVLPGRNIKLEGLGNKFSKVYYLEKVTHSISNSGYKTTFNVKESTI